MQLRLPESGMAAARVVEALDVAEDLHLKLVAGRPGPPVDQLLLQRGEERLGQGVVEASATLPMEASTPEARRVRPNSNEVY
jgi:hypothetical protein